MSTIATTLPLSPSGGYNAAAPAQVVAMSAGTEASSFVWQLARIANNGDSSSGSVSGSVPSSVAIRSAGASASGATPSTQGSAAQGEIPAGWAVHGKQTMPSVSAQADDPELEPQDGDNRQAGSDVSEAASSPIGAAEPRQRLPSAGTDARQPASRASDGPEDDAEAPVVAATLPVSAIFPPPGQAPSPVGASDGTVTRPGQKGAKPDVVATAGSNVGPATGAAPTGGPAAGGAVVSDVSHDPDAAPVPLDDPSSVAAAGPTSSRPAATPADLPTSSHAAGQARPVPSRTDPVSATSQGAHTTLSSAAPAAASAPEIRFDAVAVQDGVQATSPGSNGASAATASVASTPVLPPGADAAQPDPDGAAGQVGASLLTLASSADGRSQISLSLHPKDLGAVHVQLELAPDGSARVLVAASEPGTLRSLMANQDHLHAALDAAAVPAADRHMSFELASATTGSGTDAQTGANMSGSGQPGRQNQNGTGGNPSTGNGFSGGGDADMPPQAVKVLTARLLPTGSINITA